LGLVDVEDDAGGGGGGGGTVEFNKTSLVFVDTPVAGDNVADGSSMDVVGDDDDSPVPLIIVADVLSDVVAIVDIVSEFVFGEGNCSTSGAGGGSSS
jgi:hypothetical protein